MAVHVGIGKSKWPVLRALLRRKAHLRPTPLQAPLPSPPPRVSPRTFPPTSAHFLPPRVSPRRLPSRVSPRRLPPTFAQFPQQYHPPPPHHSSTTTTKFSQPEDAEYAITQGLFLVVGTPLEIKTPWKIVRMLV